jgi:hypothetical protein
MKMRNFLLASLIALPLGCAPGSSSGPAPTDQNEVHGYAVSSPFNGLPLVNAAKSTRMVVINVPLTGLPNITEDILSHTDQGVSKLPGLKLSLTKDSQGHNFLVVSVPAKSLAMVRPLSGDATLPNGNPLPGFAGQGAPIEIGSLPIGNITLTLYSSADAFAVFAAGPLSLPMDYNFPITDASGKQIGDLASVAPQQGFEGGFYVSFVYPPAIAQLLASIMP